MKDLDNNDLTAVWVRDMPWVLLDFMTASTVDRVVKVYREQDCGQQRPLSVYCAKPMGPAMGQDSEVWSPTLIWDHFGELMARHQVDIKYAGGSMVRASVKSESHLETDLRACVSRVVVKHMHGPRPLIDSKMLALIDPNKVWLRPHPDRRSILRAQG